MAKYIETRRELGKQSISSLTGSFCRFSHRESDLEFCSAIARMKQCRIRQAKNPPGVDEQ